jgi:hypothetical protein
MRTFVRVQDVTATTVQELIAAIDATAAALQDAPLESLDHRELMATVRQLEIARRRLDHATDRVAGHVDRSGAHRVDGHRTAKAALKHVGRIPGAEAHARVRMARTLRRLPEVAAAYARGTVPNPSARAIARVASNPRVQQFLDDADIVFAAMASTEPYDDFVGWLAEWESLADADGAAQGAEQSHRRRHATFLRNAVDGSWHLLATVGPLQGAAIAKILSGYEAAEFEADRHEAVAQHGDDATVDQFERTPGQRRADAIFEIFRRAAAMPPGAQSPEPLVNIVIDQQTFEDEVRRMCGDPAVESDPSRAGERICGTVTGEPLHPSDAVLAAVLGMVRRVVVEPQSTVIDLGRKRRCFTGSSREAALLQAALRARGGARCLWSGCDGPPGRLQIDHRRRWRSEGRTDVVNSDPYCGHHNRLKERGFRPVFEPDGTYVLVRPDGTPITPAA